MADEQAEARKTIIAGLAAAFPNAKIGADTLRMYVKATDDIDPAALRDAAEAIVRDAQWFPTIRDLRRAVTERLLGGLPDEDEAWELAERYANEPERAHCPNRECVAGVVPGGEPLVLDRAPLDAIDDPELRALLAKVADQAQESTSLCDTCGGEGTIANPRRPKLSADVRRAMEHVGGPFAIRTSGSAEVVRAQFLKAYGRMRDEHVRQANLESAGLGELAPGHRGELGR